MEEDGATQQHPGGEDMDLEEMNDSNLMWFVTLDEDQLRQTSGHGKVTGAGVAGGEGHTDFIKAFCYCEDYSERSDDGIAGEGDLNTTVEENKKYVEQLRLEKSGLEAQLNQINQTVDVKTADADDIESNVDSTGGDGEKDKSEEWHESNSVQTLLDQIIDIVVDMSDKEDVWEETAEHLTGKEENALEIALSQMSECCEDLKQKKDALEAAVNEANANITTLLGKNKTLMIQLNEDKASFESELMQMFETVETVTEERDHIKRAIEKLRVEKKSLETQLKQTNETTEKMAGEREAIEIDNKNAMEQFQCEKDGLETELNRITSIVKTMAEEKESIERNAEGNDKFVEQLQSEKDVLETQLKQLNEAVEKMTGERQAIEKNNYSVEQLRLEKSDLKVQLTHFKETLEKMNDEKEIVDKMVDENEKFVEQLLRDKDSLETEFDQIKETLESKTKEVMELKANNAMIDAENRKHLDLYTASVVDLKNLEAQVLSRNLEIESLKSQFEIKVIDRDHDIESLKSQLDFCKTERTCIVDEFSQVKDQYESIVLKYNIIEKENAELKQQMDALNSHADRVVLLESQLVAFEEEKKGMTAKVKFALNHAKKYEKLVKELQQEKEALEIELSTEKPLEQTSEERGIIEKTVHENEKFVEQLQADKKSYETQLSQFKETVDKMTEELTIIKANSEKIDEESRMYQEQYREAKLDLKKEKLRGEAILGQWRVYRHYNKKIEKEKKVINKEINSLLSMPSLEMPLLKEFICSIKKRFIDDDEEDSDIENRDIENQV